MHPSDNVLVACRSLPQGQVLRVGDHQVSTARPIPVGHKVALSCIGPGAAVVRYGEFIGRARCRIDAGEHVHTHNLAYEQNDLVAVPYRTASAAPAAASESPVFLGFSRPDGRTGTRNYVAVVATSNCASHVAHLVAQSYQGSRLPRNVDGVVVFCQPDGCGHMPGPDLDQLFRTVSGVADHPNVAGVLLIGLGCETNSVDLYRDLGDDARVATLSIQSSGGTTGSVAAARSKVDYLVERAASCSRVELPASKIVLGLNCGGSDSFSGVSANPALGVCSDLLAGVGGTAALAETPEISGAVHLLARRARDRDVAEKLYEVVRSYSAYLGRSGMSFDDNLSPGNKEGGLSNILEKSLGATAKSGSSPLMAVYDYAERIHSTGLVFMNTPGYDPASLAGLGAGGVNVIAFTTGRGSAIGFPTIPIIKIASNAETYRKMPDNIDLSAGGVLDGTASLDAIGRAIFALLLRVASGERTCSERLGHSEFVPWRLGPVP
jgi:altronate hydrolase